MRKLIISCLMTCFMLLTACHVYQPNIQQGNLITPQMISQVKPGMSKQQVENILGEPLLSNTFNDNQWAYVYTFQRNGGIIQRKNFDVYFQNNRVTRVQWSEGTI